MMYRVIWDLSRGFAVLAQTGPAKSRSARTRIAALQACLDLT